MIRDILESQRKAPQLLVENKISFAAADSELGIYDTFEQASRIKLVSDQLLFCGMVTGKKVIHAHSDAFECEFLPHESFVMAPNSPIEIDFPTASMTRPTTCLAIEISTERVNKIVNGLNADTPLLNYGKDWQYDVNLVHTHHNGQTQALLNRIVQIYTENHQDRSFMIDLAVTELIVRLLRHQTREFLIAYSSAQPDHNGLNAVISYIRENLHNSLNIDDLCKLACMSRTKFFAEFKQILGCTPNDFLYQLRLKEAAQMLKTGETITRVCFATGYANTSHFSRSFKSFYGMSPSHYKNRQAIN
ncbi:MAG: AraC family transcriptional regulator [Pseudomonadales bacterium]|nr:AraC family transcriptional regulator [Pseudomonadales bacterium]